MFKYLKGRRPDPSKVRASVTMKFEVVMTGKMDKLAEVAENWDVAMESFYAYCESRDVSIVCSSGTMRGLTQEELLFMIPRKYHFMDSECRQVCKTLFVSTKFLTSEPEKVTCKLCLKVMGASND